MGFGGLQKNEKHKFCPTPNDTIYATSVFISC